MIFTKALLYKVRLAVSPLCQKCKTPETIDHVLLHCESNNNERQKMLNSLGLPRNCSYDKVMSVAQASCKGTRALVDFSREVGLLSDNNVG